MADAGGDGGAGASRCDESDDEDGHDTSSKMPGEGNACPGLSYAGARVSSSSKGSDAKVLSTVIDKSILRGVSVPMVLRGCGACFRDRGFTQQNYRQSVQVSHLDDFVSHDWESGWVGKTLALCLIYNGWPAALCSLLGAVIIAVLESKYSGVLPVRVPPGPLEDPISEGCGYWCSALCPLLHAFMFFFWQDVRMLFRLKTKSAFVDKFCIDQDDKERKTAGILGLGGFLRHTSRLVICWTPRYFTRLWCTYEVATWLYLGKPVRGVEFMPLAHAKGIVAIWLVTCLCCELYVLVTRLGYSAMYVLIWGGSLALLLPPAMHWLRRLVTDISKLPEQLRAFSIADAGCYCCSVDHQSSERPDEALECDREMVYKTLSVWFGGQDDEVPITGSKELDLSDPRQLEEFDVRIRDIFAEMFGPWVLEHAGPTQLSYQYVALSCWPLLFRACDLLAGIPTAPAEGLLRVVFIEYPVNLLAIGPVMYKAGLLVTSWVETSTGSLPKSRCTDAALNLGCALVVVLVFLVLWVPMTLSNAYFEHPTIPLSCALANIVLAMVLYQADIFRRLPRRICGVQIRADRWLSTRTAPDGDVEHANLKVHPPLDTLSTLVTSCCVVPEGIVNVDEMCGNGRLACI